MKNIKYFFQAIIIYIIIIIIKILGLNFSRKIFSYIFKKLGIFFKSKKIILNNLNLINKFYNSSEKQKIIDKMWINYGMTFVEYFYLNRFKKNNDHIIIEGEEYLTEIINKNKPVIFISGHFGNFELMSMELVKKGINLATIYRPLNNYFINPIMEYIRRNYVCKNQIKKGLSGVKDSIKFLKKNTSVALMVDQRVTEGEKLKLFGKDTYTTTLPAQLALKFNCDIIPIYTARLENKFEMKIFQPILVKDYQYLANPNKIKLALSLKINLTLEKMIAQDPGQWILTHNKWK